MPFKAALSTLMGMEVSVGVGAGVSVAHCSGVGVRMGVAVPERGVAVAAGGAAPWQPAANRPSRIMAQNRKERRFLIGIINRIQWEG